MRRALHLLSGLCLLAGLTVGGLPTAAQAASTPTLQSGEYWYYVHAFFTTSGWNEQVCFKPPASTTIGCRGEYASATTTAPFDSGSGTVELDSSNERDWDISFNRPGAVLRGSWSGDLALFSPGSRQDVQLSGVTGEGGLPGGYAHFRTATEPGIAAGERGGPLLLGIRNLDGHVPGPHQANETAFDLRGWVIADDGGASLPALRDGEYYYYVHAFFDARSGALTWGCHRQGDSYGCSGDYSSATTTAPFIGGPGTVTAESPPSESQYLYSFYKPGAVLRGHGQLGIAHDDDVRVDLELRRVTGEGMLPNGYTYFRMDDSQGIAAGQRGGPLQLGVHTVAVSGDGSYDVTWDLRGWVIASDTRPAGATGSPDPSSTAPTEPIPPAPLATPAVPAVSPGGPDSLGVAATPRFTG